MKGGEIKERKGEERSEGSEFAYKRRGERRAMEKEWRLEGRSKR